jgi:hypothetical protein
MTKTLDKIRTSATSTVIGWTDKREPNWIGAQDGTYRGASSSLESYPGAIPDHVLYNGLFGYVVETGPAQTTYLADDGVHTITDDSRSVQFRRDIDRILGTSKEGKVVHDYADWLVRLVSNAKGGFVVDRACTLGYGAKAIVQFSVPENLDTSTGMVVRPVITGVSSVDGSYKSTFLKGGTILACNNQFGGCGIVKNLGGNLVMAIPHTRHSDKRKAEVLPSLGLVEDTANGLVQEIEALSRIDVSDKAWSAFLDAAYSLQKDGTPLAGAGLTRRENVRAELTSMYRTDLRCAPWNGTALGVVQTMSTYAAHVAPIRTGRDGIGDRDTRNAENLISGKTYAGDRHTFTLLQEVLASV